MLLPESVAASAADERPEPWMATHPCARAFVDDATKAPEKASNRATGPIANLNRDNAVGAAIFIGSVRVGAGVSRRAGSISHGAL